MASADPQTQRFVRQFRRPWPYLTLVVLGFGLGSLGGVFGGAPLAGLGVVAAVFAVVAMAWSRAAGQLRQDDVHAWGRRRELVAADSTPPPESLRVTEVGASRRFGTGLTGSLAGDHGGVVLFTWQDRYTHVAGGDPFRKVGEPRHVAIAWTTVPPLPQLIRLTLDQPGQSQVAWQLPPGTRAVSLGSDRFRARFRLLVDGAVPDEILARLFTLEVAAWCLGESTQPPLWVEAHHGLVAVIGEDPVPSRPEFLDLLVRRLEAIAGAWRAAAAGT